MPAAAKATSANSPAPGRCRIENAADSVAPSASASGAVVSGRDRGRQGQAGGGSGGRRQPPPPDSDLQGWSRSRRLSIVAGPMPLISSSCSTEERPPC